MKKTLRDNGLGLVFGALLILTLVGQGASGQSAYNGAATIGGLQQISFWEYVGSSDFAVDVAENWQSEYLQFLLFILLTIWFLQRGSSESKQPDDIGRQSDQQQKLGRYAEPDSPAWVRAGGWRTTVYSHSLAGVMGAVFALSWAAQLLAGEAAYNEERLAGLQAPVSVGDYLVSADFWNRTLQNWQSELLAVGSMVVFSVYLRERGSPESKPVGAPHDWTAG